MKDILSGSGPFEMGAWAPTGDGFLTVAPRDPEDVLRSEGFEQVGWGRLAPITAAPAALRPQYAKVLFGNNRMGQQVPPGQVSITYEEATTFLEFINIVLAPLAPEEREAEGAREACKRELQAGSFPILTKLQERLAAFTGAGDTSATFVMTKGEMNVLDQLVQ